MVSPEAAPRLAAAGGVAGPFALGSFAALSAGFGGGLSLREQAVNRP